MRGLLLYTVGGQVVTELVRLLDTGDASCLTAVNSILTDKKGSNGLAAYLEHMVCDGVWGGEVELGAVTAAFGLPVVLYEQFDQHSCAVSTTVHTAVSRALCPSCCAGRATTTAALCMLSLLLVVVLLLLLLLLLAMVTAAAQRVAV